MKHVNPALQSGEPLVRRAAFMSIAVSSEGCADHIRNKSVSSVFIVTNHRRIHVNWTNLTETYGALLSNLPRINTDYYYYSFTALKHHMYIINMQEHSKNHRTKKLVHALMMQTELSFQMLNQQTIISGFFIILAVIGEFT